MSKSEISNDLLGQKVKIISSLPNTDLEGKIGVIRAVFKTDEELKVCIEEEDGSFCDAWLNCVKTIE